MKDNELPDYHRSIFHQLFEHASDQDCKLILLNQILEIGDEREIPLLTMMENATNPIIGKRATEVKKQLIFKIKGHEVKEKELLPMSLCFLYKEFDIRPADFNPDKDIGFEISPDIYENE